MSYKKVCEYVERKNKVYSIWDLLFDVTKEEYMENKKVSIAKWYDKMKFFIVNNKCIEDDNKIQLLKELDMETRKKLQELSFEGELITIDKELAKKVWS